MKKQITIVLIALMMLSTVALVAAQEEPDDFNLIDFLFTSLGQQVGCETYPESTGVFNSPKTISCTGGEFPGTDNCLINVFHDNYAGTDPAFECGNVDLEGEVNGCLEYIVTTGSRTVSPIGTNSIYEVYNCPIGSLEGGSTGDIGDCDCDFGATGSTCDSTNTCGPDRPKCMEVSGDDVCVTTGQYATECSNGLDGSSVECDCDSGYFDTDWKNQRCPSTKPYCIIDGGIYDACSTSPSGAGVDTCSNQGGTICGGTSTCSGSAVSASDTSACCIGTCESSGTTGGTGALTCKNKEEIFYSNGDATIKNKKWLLIPVTSSTTSGDLIQQSELVSGKVDEILPGFSSRYFDNIQNGCCEGLEPSFLGEKRVESSSWSLISLIEGSEKAIVNYAQYKCVNEGEAGFCMEFAHTALDGFTNLQDCTQNTYVFILLIGGLITLLVVLAR